MDASNPFFPHLCTYRNKIEKNPLKVYFCSKGSDSDLVLSKCLDTFALATSSKLWKIFIVGVSKPRFMWVISIENFA